MTQLQTVNRLTDQQVRNWCLYLSALHNAVCTAAFNTLVQPLVSPKCPRLQPPHWKACGTCYACTEQAILRALHCSNVSRTEIPGLAHTIGDAVYEWVTHCDEKLGTDDHDDYIAMDGPQYAQVMGWAAGVQDQERRVFGMVDQLVADSRCDDRLWLPAHADGATDCPRECGHVVTTHRTDIGCALCDCTYGLGRQPVSYTDPAPAGPAPVVTLQEFDAWGRPRCTFTVAYSDVPDQYIQCVLTVGHDGPCDTLPEWPGHDTTAPVPQPVQISEPELRGLPDSACRW